MFFKRNAISKTLYKIMTPKQKTIIMIRKSFDSSM